jgi:Helix-hairpin-helix domain
MVVIQSSDPIHAAKQIEGLHENSSIANQLLQIADLLADQHANEFRVRAYRAAAETIAQFPKPIRDVMERDGLDGLVALPTIGQSIASLIESSLRIGRIPLLDRLRGQSKAEHFFATLPGIGPQLSHRIHEHLHVETLAELRRAASDGRLQKVPGLGKKRVEAIKACLAHRSADHTMIVHAVDESDAIPVDELLDIDREYRMRVGSGTLAKVNPSQHNPAHESWLPIMHAERDGRHYTAMYSNTAKAHQLHATHDWVVIFRDDADHHGRWTVITSQFGKLQGSRIVRGREEACLDYYRRNNAFHHPEASQPPHSEQSTKFDEGESRRGLHE